MLKFAHLKDMCDIDLFNISVVYGGKQIKQGRGGLYVITAITYKIPFVVNG